MALLSLNAEGWAASKPGASLHTVNYAFFWDKDTVDKKIKGEKADERAIAEDGSQLAERGSLCLLQVLRDAQSPLFHPTYSSVSPLPPSPPVYLPPSPFPLPLHLPPLPSISLLASLVPPKGAFSVKKRFQNPSSSHKDKARLSLSSWQKFFGQW